MEIDDFWTLVDQAREDSSVDGSLPTGKAIGAALSSRLAALPPARIVAFQHRLTEQLDRADQWAVCAAAFAVWQYISDDSFADFTAGLVGLGRDTFEHAMSNADNLADNPTVQAIATGQLDEYALNGEAILYAAAQAYGQHTDDPDDFWDAVQAVPGAEDQKQVGEPWDGRFGGADDQALIPLRLPRLSALFDATDR